MITLQGERLHIREKCKHMGGGSDRWRGQEFIITGIYICTGYIFPFTAHILLFGPFIICEFTEMESHNTALGQRIQAFSKKRLMIMKVTHPAFL
jgi:hypothetical protein